MKQPIPDIAQCVEQNLQQYFKDLNGTEPCAVYEREIGRASCRERV